MDTHLARYLEDKGIDYTLHEHPAVFTVAQSSTMIEIQNIPGIRTKNLFLKSDDGKYFLVCMSAHKRLDMKLIKRELGKRSLEFASSDELKKELSLTPGSVSIFGMIYSSSVTLIIDKEVYDSPIVGFHPNINTATVEMDHANLDKFLSTLDCIKKIISL